MRIALCLLPLLLAACPSSDPKPDTGDPQDTDTGEKPLGPLDMAVGDVADMESVEDGSVTAEVLQPGTYLVVLVSTDTEQGTLYGYGADAKARRIDPCDVRPDRRPASDTPVPPPDVKTGDTRSFTISTGNWPTIVEAEAILVTDTVILWEDRTTPNEIGSVDYETLEEVAADFAAIVIPRQEQVFGAISDVDDDGRISVLLSYTVNEYGAQAYVTGCDIGDFDGCGSSSNEGEVVYLAYPDPDDAYASVNGIVETVAHELNHLVYDWHKYLLQGSSSADENVYVTEGMSALAQDLSGYNNGNQYVWAAAIDMSETYGSDDYSVQAVSLNDILRGSSWYDQDRDGALRGGAYLILRYLFEQAGGMTVDGSGAYTDAGGIAWLHTWFDSPAYGPDAVEATTGMTMADVAMDFYTALGVTGLGINTDPRFNFQPREADPITGYEYGVDPYDNIHGWLQLTGVPVQEWDKADGEIRAGGVEYLRVVSQGGGIHFPADPAAMIRARLVRVE